MWLIPSCSPYGSGTLVIVSMTSIDNHRPYLILITVRFGAAIALGDYLRAYQDNLEVRQSIQTLIGTSLQKIREQPLTLLSPSSNPTDRTFHCSHGPEPWEVSDGGLHLLLQYATILPHDPFSLTQFQLLVEVSSIQAFPRSHMWLDSFWNQVADIFESLDAHSVHAFLQQFIPTLQTSLQSNTQSVRVASRRALLVVESILGSQLNLQ